MGTWAVGVVYIFLSYVLTTTTTTAAQSRGGRCLLASLRKFGLYTGRSAAAGM